MNLSEFSQQMDRLERTWPRSWPVEKTKLIQVAVQKFDVLWFERVVTKFISQKKSSPLAQDFIDEAKKEDRRIHFGGCLKREDQSVLSDEERAEFFQLVKEAASGKYNKEQVKTIAMYMDGILRSKGITPDPWGHL